MSNYEGDGVRQVEWPTSFGGWGLPGPPTDLPSILSGGRRPETPSTDTCVCSQIIRILIKVKCGWDQVQLTDINWLNVLTVILIASQKITISNF